MEQYNIQTLKASYSKNQNQSSCSLPTLGIYQQVLPTFKIDCVA